MSKRFFIGLISLGLLGCGDSGPVAGALSLDLASPGAAVGAVQFRITATLPNTITGLTAACTGCQLFHAIISDTEVRGVVIGTIASGALLSLSVSDKNSPEAYTGVVSSVAGTNFQLISPAGYVLRAPLSN